MATKSLDSVVRHSLFKITSRFWIISAVYYFVICNSFVFVGQKLAGIPKENEISFVTLNLILLLPGFLLAHRVEGIVLERRREAFVRTMAFIKNRMEYQIVEVDVPSLFSRLLPRIWRPVYNYKKSVSVECYVHMDRKFEARLYQTGISGFFPIHYVAIPTEAFKELQRQGNESAQRLLDPNLGTFSKVKIWEED